MLRATTTCRCFCWAAVLLLWLVEKASAQAPPNYADYELLWAEEFAEAGDSSVLAPRWGFAYPWGRNIVGQPETEYYTGSEVSIQHGLLYLTAHRLAQPRPYQLGAEKRQLRYTSGMLHSQLPGLDSLRLAPCPPTPGGFGYGLFEIRCRLPRGGGAFPAFWLAGHDEFDIFEGDEFGFGSNVVEHENGYWRPAIAGARSCQCLFYSADRAPFYTDFHTYTLRWAPGELTFFFDGVPIRHETRFRTLGCPLNLIVNLAMWNWATPAQDTLAVDYIRVWRPRQPPLYSFAVGDYRVPPVGLNAIPRYETPNFLFTASQRTWALSRDTLGHLSLNLTENHNPPCGGWQSLPAGGRWRLPWVWSRLNETPAALVVFGGSAALGWKVVDGHGRAVLAGTAPAGRPWQPRWPTGLPAGAYWVQLRLLDAPNATVWHPFYVLDLPSEIRPTPGWYPKPMKAE